MYTVTCAIVVGDTDAEVDAAVAFLLRGAWKNAPGVVYRLQATADEVLRTFSFLVASSLHNPLRSAREGRQLPHRILPFLYLGDYDSARNPLLPSLNITHIVNASGGFENHFPERMQYLNVDVWDSPEAEIERHFDATVAFVDQARARNGACLIHCAAGVSRSTTLTLAYLMVREKMSLRQAFIHTKSIRTIVCPNSGFVQKLVDFEIRVFGAPSVAVPKSLSSEERYFGLSLGELIVQDMEKQGPVEAATKDLLLT